MKVPYGGQAAFATAVLLYELATGGKHPIRDYSNRPKSSSTTQVPVFGDAEAAGDWSQSGGGPGPSSGAGADPSNRDVALGAEEDVDGQRYPAWFEQLVGAMLRWDPARRPSLFDARRCIWREEAWSGVGVGIADAEAEARGSGAAGGASAAAPGTDPAAPPEVPGNSQGRYPVAAGANPGEARQPVAGFGGQSTGNDGDDDEQV